MNYQESHHHRWLVMASLQDTNHTHQLKWTEVEMPIRVIPTRVGQVRHHVQCATLIYITSPILLPALDFVSSWACTV